MRREDQIGILLKAVSGVYADDELTPRERSEIVAEVFEDYEARTGRDGLADIASVRPGAPAVMKAETRRELAMLALEGRAEAMRKANPSLTQEQAFARVYSDPANRELALIERNANLAKFAEQAVAAQDGESTQKRLLIATRDGAIDEIWKRADELRRSDQSLTREQAFAKVYSNPANRSLAVAERSASRAALQA